MIVLDRRRIAVFVAGASAFLDMYCTQALLPDLARHFGASPAEIGLTITMSTLATALVAPMIGALADMVGRKRVIVVGALALVLPTLGLALADTLPAMLVLRFLQGLCMPAIFTVTMAYVGEEWPQAQVPEVVSLYTGGTALGGVSGRLVTAVAADFLGWREAFVVLGAVNLAAGLLIWWLLPPAKGWRASGSLAETLRAAAGHLRNPRLVATFGIGFTILFSLVATFTYGTFYLAAWPFNLSTTGQGLIFLVYLLGMVAAPIGGKVIARIGPVRGMAMAVGAVCLGQALTLATSLPLVVAGLGLMVCGIFVCQTASISTISATAKSSRSAAMGLYVTLYYVGGSLGAVAPAPAWHAFGWAGCVAIVVAVALGGLGLAVRYWTARPV
ncbi:MAG: MFS transporter [Bacteroidota bacterium]